MQIQGTFNAQKFFDTLANIISRRENVEVSVEVKQTAPENDRRKTA